jgi:type I restriction enzyme M protein
MNASASFTIVQRRWNYCNVLRGERHALTRPLVRADLDEFVACYHPENRHDRMPTWSPETPDKRWRSFTYEELLARDKVNPDIFWLRDESLEYSARLPDPDVLAAEIVEDLQSALEQFKGIAAELGE